MNEPLAQRKDAKGEATFDLHQWWKGNYGDFPAWGYVLRAVLTNSTPNSIPPERVFSILNDTFGDDQKTGRRRADYKEFSLMKKYNAVAISRDACRDGWPQVGTQLRPARASSDQ